MDPNFVKAVETEDDVLDDSVEDDGPKPGSTAMDCTGTSGGLSLSFRDESMRMERLLGSICQPLLIFDF
ncbi:hypothetical protein EMCRGX_G017941 [Ephydatia muelleri]